jgi:hypothetical protein
MVADNRKGDSSNSIMVAMTETMVAVMVMAAMTEMVAVAIAMTMAEIAVADNRTVIAVMIEIVCQRGHWPISSISETRIIWNITTLIFISYILICAHA